MFLQKYLLLFGFVLSPFISNCQNEIEWNETYQLQLSDFQSGTTKVGEGNIYSLMAASRMSFSFYMSTYEFMFTKNFNPKVNCTFNRKASSLIAPDKETANFLVSFARFEFDLTELYARKFRKKLFDNKGAFSDAKFFEPIYDSLQSEFTERNAFAISNTKIGQDTIKLKSLHNQVSKEILELPDFCKTCKPQKK
ncbi:MAG: hypothetical protein H7329_04920 [Opitutaceae bacterium]|nr:hypothetical protein [Cytophagales bacterium]